jgi:hypothetical protein
MSIYTSYAEQEHADHVAGCASEFQNCYSEAKSKVTHLSAQHGTRIHRARSLGLWVVTQDIAYYCRTTDAIAGSYEEFISAHPTEEAALAKAEKRWLDYNDIDFGRINVIAPL